MSIRRSPAIPAALAAALLGGGAAAQHRGASEPDAGKRLDPRPVVLRSVPKARATVTPLGGATAAQGTACPPIVRTHSTANFAGGAFVIQAGMVEQEVAAASYSVPVTEFPIILNLAEIVFAQQNAIVTTTTMWSILVWEGTPATGTIVAEFSSDDLILPHIVIPPGTNGVNLNFAVEPTDPDQIVIQNNGTATFSVGFRIDDHNNEPTTGCGLPAPCCPPPSTSNAFPTTDTGGLNFPTMNWLKCLSGCGLFACPGGWHSFNQLGAFMPSGDWNIRVTYTSTVGCQPGVGACCFIDGSCGIEISTECTAAGGDYQGDGIGCTPTTCPDPEGACCAGGGCADGVSASDCASVGGAWLGAGSACNVGICNGACCVPATGGCLNLDQQTCVVAVGGVFSGAGTLCATTVCFPEGACCLPDGTCMDGQSDTECLGLGGAFQGDMTACSGLQCPLPAGACCIAATGACLLFTQASCAIAGGAWQGPASNCADGNGNMEADACEEPPCPGDLDGSGIVGFADLNQLLNAWGDCPGCPEDFDGNGNVGFADLNVVLGNWGPCA